MPSVSASRTGRPKRVPSERALRSREDRAADARPDLGAWAAGQFATRAVAQAAAQELRAEGVHVALLAVDALIESPKTEPFTAAQPRDALASMEAVAEAVVFLAQQGPRSMTHDLTVTPALDRWLP